MENANQKLFTDIGLKEGVVKSTLASKKTTKKLVDLLTELNVSACDADHGNLLYSVATTCGAKIFRFSGMLGKMVMED